MEQLFPVSMCADLQLNCLGRCLQTFLWAKDPATDLASVLHTEFGLIVSSDPQGISVWPHATGHDTMLRENGMDLRHREAASFGEILAMVSDRVASEMPVLLKVNSFCWQPAPTYQRRHSLHMVIAHGYRLGETDREVYISDNSFSFRGWVPVDVLQRAMETHPDGTVGRPRYVDIVLVPRRWSNLDEQITWSLREAARGYDGSRALLPGYINEAILAGEFELLACGALAYEYVAEYIASMAHMPQEQMLEQMDSLYQQFLYVSLARYWYGRFLGMSSQAHAPAIQSLIQSLAHSASSWRVCANMLLKGKFAGDVGMLPRAEKRFREVVEAELTAWRTLTSVYKDLQPTQ